MPTKHTAVKNYYFGKFKVNVKVDFSWVLLINHTFFTEIVITLRDFNSYMFPRKQAHLKLN